MTLNSRVIGTVRSRSHAIRPDNGPPKVWQIDDRASGDLRPCAARELIWHCSRRAQGRLRLGERSAQSTRLKSTRHTAASAPFRTRLRSVRTIIVVMHSCRQCQHEHHEQRYHHAEYDQHLATARLRLRLSVDCDGAPPDLSRESAAYMLLLKGLLGSATAGGTCRAGLGAGTGLSARMRKRMVQGVR